jgi:hypothetical protein
LFLDSPDCTGLINRWFAELAQLVERRLAKAKVAGSNPVFRSNSNVTLPAFSTSGRIRPGWGPFRAFR